MFFEGPEILLGALVKETLGFLVLGHEQQPDRLIDSPKVPKMLTV